ncbi:hypothetical protein ACE6H2_021382 [Prunus campanulata]
MAHKIKKINSSLVNLKNEAPGIGLVASSTSQGGSSHDAGVDRETVSSFAQDEKYIVGREKVVLEIVTTLIDSSNTRKNSLSVMPITLPMCNLGKLSDDQCWLILKNRASPPNSAPLTKDQERIGTDIARKCAGLPLLAKHLKGKISIYHLEHVRDIEQAKKAKLAEKRNIRKLKFEWGKDRSSAINNDRDILEGLEPHSELEILKICNFSSDQFPSWMTSGNLFSSLKKISIDNAKNLMEWTGAAIFPRLEELFLRNCNQLKSAPTHFPCLQKLTIDSMDSGMPIANISTQLTTLTHLTIKKTRGLASLLEGMLKKNKNLSYLEIEDCPDLTCIAADVFGCCASLESLFILRCPNLRTLPDGLHTLLSLKELIIRYCDSLECIPATQGLASLCKFPIFKCLELCILPEGLECYTSLQKLIIECSKITSIPITHSLPSLRQLEISNCDELSSLPSGLQHCTSLEHLSITNCPNLEAIPSLDSLTQLRKLEINNCDGLKGVPLTSAFAASLTRLKFLSIGGFWKELDSFPTFQVISRLEILTLNGWPKLKSLPEQVQHFTSLTSLTINSFDGMEALPEWLGNLVSLRCLFIYHCKNLMYLPTLETMKCLAKLQFIRIRDCPLLKNRYNEYCGPEWPKILHIPIFFDFMDWFWDL